VAGVTSATARYPDVITWSPDANARTLLFDAFNSVPLGIGAVDFWGIYELNLGVGKIYNLLPAQPNYLSVGNITYSKTNPSLVAFNTIDGNTGLWDIQIGDFGTGQITSLNMPSVSVDGIQVTDAQRPTFSPDDSELCMTTPFIGVLLFMEMSSGNFGLVDMGQPLYNPHWFVIGGTQQGGTDVESEQPSHELTLHHNYPNPFSTSTTVRFELQAPASVDVGVFDLLGRRVGTVTAGPRTAGLHEVVFDGSHLATGTYFLRLIANGAVDHRQMIVVR
ncbi:MAG TPA: T9SS type A sorting domain-containing protein, partial [Rhodothermales bacterium]